MGIQPLDRSRRTPARQGRRQSTRTAAGAAPPPAGARTRLRPGPHGRERDHRQVLVHQRARLCEAMVHEVSEHGYAGTTVQELTRLAGVSKRSFYEQFTGKQDCMLAAFDSVAADAIQRPHRCCAACARWDERLRALLLEAADYAARHPRHARLCVIDALLAGPELRARLEASRSALQAAVLAALRDQLGPAAPPPFAVAALMRGAWHLLASALLRDEAELLAGLAEPLGAWALSYCCPAGAPPAQPPVLPGRPLAPLSPPPAGEPRARLMRAALQIAGRHGRAALDRRALLALARVAPQDLARLYESPEECFTDALGLLAAAALAPMLAAGRAAPDGWVGAVRAGIAALLDWAAREPVLARVAFVEALGGGWETLLGGSLMLGNLARVVFRTAGGGQRVHPAIGEAIVAAIWWTMHDYVAAGSIRQLPALREPLAFLVLAPTVGSERALPPARRRLGAGR